MFYRRNFCVQNTFVKCSRCGYLIAISFMTVIIQAFMLFCSSKSTLYNNEYICERQYVQNMLYCQLQCVCKGLSVPSLLQNV